METGLFKHLFRLLLQRLCPEPRQQDDVSAAGAMEFALHH